MKKQDLPAMPFYWGDWFKATDLQSLPHKTRCVWFEMLGRMWESNERGYLTIGGKPMTDFAKARALGFGSNVDEYLEHEKVLEECGVFSRRKSDSAIYSRKILNDIELSKKRAEAGSKGGRKTWGFAIPNAKASAKANTEYENEYEIENETIKKGKDKKIGSEAKELLKAFGDLHKQIFGETYISTFAKDMNILKQLLKDMPKEQIENRMKLFFESEDKFINEAGYTIGVFRSCINKIISQKKRQDEQKWMKEMGIKC